MNKNTNSEFDGKLLEWYDSSFSSERKWIIPKVYEWWIEYTKNFLDKGISKQKLEKYRRQKELEWIMNEKEELYKGIVAAAKKTNKAKWSEMMTKSEIDRIKISRSQQRAIDRAKSDSLYQRWWNRLVQLNKRYTNKQKREADTTYKNKDAELKGSEVEGKQYRKNVASDAKSKARESSNDQIVDNINLWRRRRQERENKERITKYDMRKDRTDTINDLKWKKVLDDSKRKKKLEKNVSRAEKWSFFHELGMDWREWLRKNNKTWAQLRESSKKKFDKKKENELRILNGKLIDEENAVINEVEVVSKKNARALIRKSLKNDAEDNTEDDRLNNEIDIANEANKRSIDREYVESSMRDDLADTKMFWGIDVEEKDLNGELEADKILAEARAEAAIIRAEWIAEKAKKRAEQLKGQKWFRETIGDGTKNFKDWIVNGVADITSFGREEEVKVDGNGKITKWWKVIKLYPDPVIPEWEKKLDKVFRRYMDDSNWGIERWISFLLTFPYEGRKVLSNGRRWWIKKKNRKIRNKIAQ